MLKLKIKIGEKYYKREIPQEEGELSLRFYLRFVYAHKKSEGNESKLLSYLLDIPLEGILLCKDVNLDSKVFSAIMFLDDSLAKKLETIDIPKEIKVGEKVYKIPNNLEFESLGQKLEAKELLNKSDDLQETIPEITAIYLDFENKDTLKEDLLDQRALKILPIAQFFFRKFRGYQKNGAKR